jgi:hypothetical protein
MGLLESRWTFGKWGYFWKVQEKVEAADPKHIRIAIN